MGIKIISKNKRASYDYSLQEFFEAGIMLQGTEVKSLRDGKAVIADAHVTISGDEVWVHNLYIPHYSFGNIHNHEETRKRKLLLHKHEIKKIQDLKKQQALTIIPTKLYFKGQFVKIEIALAKGKKLHDKRQDLKKKDVEKKLKRGIYE